MTGYKVSRQAVEDLDDTAAFIGNESAVEKWLSRIENVFEHFVAFPAVGVLREELGKGVRAFPVSDYVIYYRRGKQSIEILRVLHASRDVEMQFGLKPGQDTTP